MAHCGVTYISIFEQDMSHSDVTYFIILKCIKVENIKMKGSNNTENNKSPLVPKVEIKIPTHNVKVPKEIILQNTYPEHRISALFYLNYNQTWDGMVNYSPIYMIHWC